MTKPLSTTEVLATVVEQVAQQVARATVVSTSVARRAPSTPVTPTPVTPLRRRPSPTFATITDDERMGLRIAIHEAGHAVAATLLGGEIRAAVLGGGKTFGMLGKTVHRTVPTGGWASILYAGPWAEARFLAGGRPSARQLDAIMADTGHLDRGALCAAAAANVHGDPSAEARLTVPTLMERAWPSVVAVAQTIHRNGEARHADVCKALGLPEGDQGGPGSAALVSIRAGLRAVPPIPKRVAQPA